MGNTVETRWFEFSIMGDAGMFFATIEDIKAEVELDDDGNLLQVVSIFTENSNRVRVELSRGDLRNDIEYYVENNFDDLRDDEPQGGRDDEHRLTAGELGVGGKR
jgi:hypothetical protein